MRYSGKIVKRDEWVRWAMQETNAKEEVIKVIVRGKIESMVEKEEVMRWGAVINRWEAEEMIDLLDLSRLE